MFAFVPFRIRSSALWLAFAALLAGCAGPTPERAEQADPVDGAAALMLSQSSSTVGETPGGWRPWIIRPDKTRTRYQVVRASVDGHERPVLHAVAESAASGMWVPVHLPAAQAPYVRWSWRTDTMIERADSSRPETEDAPARLVLAFDGDWRKLPLRDQMLAETARMLLGREVPYATLIYTWDTGKPVGANLANAHTSRIRLKVVESGPERTGRWLDYERNYVQDYIELFGEEPGTLIGVGVMTDSDNTRGYAESWYGDIQLLTPSRTALGELPDGPVID
ncbi:DUF3047 domain-containing protein [Pigmentiphaga sp. H8]|uniref:DUF3047 domain-containing protein n=1 Tax=Pigmentiphaga sp. H8 TaxID=2488560 RepID=UPI000F5B6CB6|nr:DUF3047 domain-containing protein [Pigmentiphaga sp. H8]AZG10597.1 DUF3047 domain-containing protein [Pigmentiphaga sp. H8]